MDDVRHLIECKPFGIVDLTGNYIKDPEVIDEVFAKMPGLRVLYLKTNPCIKKTKNYRRNLISKIKLLSYLDDRPVFPEDRRYAEAWFKGGMKAEREERVKVRREKEAEAQRQHREFRDQCQIWRDEAEEGRTEAERLRMAELLGEEEEEKIVDNSDQ